MGEVSCHFFSSNIFAGNLWFVLECYWWNCLQWNGLWINLGCPTCDAKAFSLGNHCKVFSTSYECWLQSGKCSLWSTHFQSQPKMFGMSSCFYLHVGHLKLLTFKEIISGLAPASLFLKWSQQVNRKGHSSPSWQTASHSNLVKLVAWTWPFFPTSSRLIEQPNTLNYCRIIPVCRMLLDAQWHTCNRVHASNHTLTY